MPACRQSALTDLHEEAVLDQCRLDDVVELEVQDGRLIIQPVQQARLGWDDAFRRMAEHGDDEVLDRESLHATEWDRTEWEW